MSKLRRAVIYSFVSRYALRLIGFVSTILVARILTPGEIGTFSIASAIIMVVSEFRLLGAGSYLVRERDIPTDKIRSALGLTFVISWGAGLLVFASSYWVADFYRLPEVANIFQILSVSFFLAPYVSIPAALLQRSFKFNILFKISFFSTLGGFIVTISSILAGLSFYGLAIGQVAKVIFEFFLVVYFWPKEMRWIPLFSGLKPIASVGIYTSLVGLIRRAHVTVPDMVIGKLGNSVQVAMFSRGLGLVEFISQTVKLGVNPVALPFLSETRRSGGDMASAYTKASVLLGGVVCPVLAVAGLASLPAIRLMFGNQWDEAAPLASWLSLWGIIQTIHWLSVMVLIAQSCERILLTKEIVILAIFVAVVAMLYPFGLEVIAQGFVGVALLDFVISSIVLRAKIALKFIPYMRAWISNFCIAATCAGATLLIGLFIDFNADQHWKPILAIAIVLPFVWLGSLKLFKHPLYGEVERMLLSRLKRNTATKG